jgi:hypothetical protein
MLFLLARHPLVFVLALAGACICTAVGFFLGCWFVGRELAVKPERN